MLLVAQCIHAGGQQRDAHECRGEASELVVGDECGELFHSPRKDRGTTTEQYLDPARLDHYVTLLELPERMHAPLRRIAEREAAGAARSTG